MKRRSIKMNNSILEVLKNSKEPLLIREVWLKSEYKNDIRSFYETLKTHVEQGEIIEMSRNGKQSQLRMMIQPEVKTEKILIDHLKAFVSTSILIPKYYASSIHLFHLKVNRLIFKIYQNASMYLVINK